MIRNLTTPEQVRRFYCLFREHDVAFIYLISDNWHFLRELQTDAFDVLDAAGFVHLWDTDAL